MAYRVLAALAVVSATFIGVLSCQSQASSSYGAVPDGVTVFDDDVPAVAKLDPELREALREAATYGSEKKAARWVATAWLKKHGAGYGLCQIYRNEPWHYELRPEAIDHRCPPKYADPTHDPRMQQ